MDDVTGGQDEPKRPVVSRRRGLGKGLGAILPSPAGGDDEGSRRDQLTGLPNRSALDERFNDAMARCRQDDASLAVLVVALDGFSSVNEMYGHSVGDELLHDAAARLSGARRRSDTVARFAGDEFVLVCPYVASVDLASDIATRILEDLSRPTTVDGAEIQLAASIGVVVTSPRETPDGAPTLETLLGDASLAMRRAKDEGGASWKLFDPSMREDVVVRSQNRQDLRAALDSDGLALDYEDIVDLETGVAVGESAILGWSHPGPDVEQPQAPLDLVDEAGLAVPVGRWVLDQALSDLTVRRAESPLPEHFRVWVKVAPSLVADPAILEIVAELTAKRDVSPSVLGLDVREPSAAAAAATESNLHALRESGVLVALDDFGSGQSNLPLLQRLPISSLKLAPDLVAALGDDPAVPDSVSDRGSDLMTGSHPATVEGTASTSTATTDEDGDDEDRRDSRDDSDQDGRESGDQGSDRSGDRNDKDVDSPSDDSDRRATTLIREASALVRGLLELGRALDLTVVAQGVESATQVAALRALGCAYAQGPFLVGREASAGDPDPAHGGAHGGSAGDPACSTEAAAVAPAASPPAAESLWAPGTLTT